MSSEESKVDIAEVKTPEIEEKLSIDQIMGMIDMEELKKFNPKLHDQISNNPSQLLELQDVIL